MGEQQASQSTYQVWWCCWLEEILTRDEAEMFIYPSTLPTGVLPLAAKLAHLHLLSVGC